MTRVCLVGESDANLQYELLSRETAREALAAYDLTEPFHNAIGVETVSLGAAVALLNDLDWYLVRFVDVALVQEPSVSDSEWLSRELASDIRDDRIEPEATGRFLKLYGLEPVSTAGPGTDSSPDQAQGGPDGSAEPSGDDGQTRSSAANEDDDQPHRLVEPMLVARTGETIPEYDIRDVEETLVVRVTESEFGA